VKSKLFPVVAVVLGIGVLVALVGFINHVRNTPKSAIVEITLQNFNQEVAKSTVPVYLEWYSSQNSPASASQKAIVEKVAPSYAGKVKFARIDAVANMPAFQQIGIRVVPTHMLINPATKNIVVAEGILSEADLRKFIDDGLTAQPAAQPAQPTAQPTAQPDPNAQPNQPATQPAPTTQPDPKAQPNQPATQPAPSTQPTAPTAQPVQPAAQPLRHN